MALIFDEEDVLQLVGFQIGAKLFGANILNVREILRDPEVDSVGNLPDFIEGIVRLRGEVLPIIDLRKILGIPAPASRERTWALVAKAGQRNVGYTVDAVTPIIRVKNNAVYPAPDIILDGLRSKYISGVCDTEKGLLVVVDFDRILLDEEIRKMNKLDIV